MKVEGKHKDPAETINKPDALLTSTPADVKDGFFPPHFMKATFQKIGGRSMVFTVQGNDYHVLIMPGKTPTECTARIVSGVLDSGIQEELLSVVHNKLQRAGYINPNIYDFQQRMSEDFAFELVEEKDGLTYGSPNREQAMRAQQLQKRVWGSEDSLLYPFDLYHRSSGTATHLVATNNDDTVAFLLGFYAEGTTWQGRKGFKKGRWIESQVMAVHEEYREKNIAKQLKILQRGQALKEGIPIIHWTFDPLQYKNAILNFNSLGGLAAEFHKGHYQSFNNDLNRVPASRFGVTWQLDSLRAQRKVEDTVTKEDAKRKLQDRFNELISQKAEIVYPVHDGNSFDAGAWKPTTDSILVAIPKDWNGIQQTNVQLATMWRSTSDTLFEKILHGKKPHYAFCEVVCNEGQYYLVASKLNMIEGIV
jgi:predicted GNAT superfamily acetyltransferase